MKWFSKHISSPIPRTIDPKPHTTKGWLVEADDDVYFFRIEPKMSDDDLIADLRDRWGIFDEAPITVHKVIRVYYPIKE